MSNGAIVASKLKRRIAANVGVPIAFGVLGSGLFEANTIWPAGVWVLYIGGTIGLLTLGAIQWVRAYRDAVAIATTDSEINDLRIAVKESIAPIAILLSEMPNLTEGAKRKHVQRVADKATSVTAHLLLLHIPQVRANVFVLNQAGTALQFESTGGAGDPPGSFELGQPDGDVALAWVKAAGEPLVVADVSKNQTPGSETRPGSRRYQSFVSVVIRSGPYSYGMVTIDSPKADAFTVGSVEVEIAKVIAELLAVGYAGAYPGQSAGSAS